LNSAPETINVAAKAIAKPSLDLNSEEADDVEEFQDPRRKTKEKGVPKPANPTEKQEKKRRAPSEAKEVVSPKKAKKAVTKPATEKPAPVEKVTEAESHF